MKTDTELQRDVLGKLKAESNINAGQISVAVNSGVVTLSGDAASLNEKWTAEETAADVPGVYAVVDDLEVQLPGGAERNDRDIAGEALTVLALNPSVPSDRIKVLVDNGWLTLEGSVDRQSEKEAAEQTSRNLTGLKGITDNIQIRDHDIAESVKASIDQALERDGTLDAKQIRVVATDSRVILEGQVHSRDQRDKAARITCSIPGVRLVENHVRVVRSRTGQCQTACPI